MKGLFYFLLFFVAVGLTSCGNDACDDEEQAAADSEELLDVAFAYGFNPTEDNCRAYRDALADYLDTYGSCDGVDQASIEESRQSLNDLPCN